MIPPDSAPTTLTEVSEGPRDSHTSRIIAVIEALVESGEPIGPRKLARRAGVDRSAVARILRQLSEVGIVERDTGGYVAGARLFALSRTVAALDSLAKAAMPILRSLAEQFNETCYVCVRQGDACVLIHQVSSTRLVRYVVELDQPFPLYAGASGLAILSGLAPGELSDYLARTTLEPLTALTVADEGRLREMIEEGKTLGYSVTEGERIEGGFAAASPFFDEGGICRGSMVFTLPLSRLNRARIPEYGAAVQEAALALTARLGSRSQRRSKIV